VILWKTSHSASEGDTRGDRPWQYRPCPVSARPAGVRVAGSAAADAGHVRERADACRGGRGLRRPVWPARAGAGQRPHGYRHRDFDTRAGTLDVAIPKLRSGSYFPDWLLERRRRAEAALTSVVATCYLLGVSTRRMEKLVEPLGITRLSRSQVSEMARDLDEQVAAFRAAGGHWRGQRFGRAAAITAARGSRCLGRMQ
jgi:Transposase, Mutator family